ncbi:MAG: hypothetical protein RR234_02070, partial [Christensenella sp.]
MHKFIKDHKGGVTVFITCILVPSVLFAGAFIDLAMNSAMQMSNALKLSAESSLSNYNGLLKQVYGLMALSGKGAANNNDLWAVSVDPFSPLASTEIKNQLQNDGKYFVPQTSEKYTAFYPDDFSPTMLSNECVLQTQISDYMKYRAPAIYFSEISNVKEITSSIENSAKDAAAVDAAGKLSSQMETLDKSLKELYNACIAHDAFKPNEDINNCINDANKEVESINSKLPQLSEKEAQLQAMVDEPNAETQDKAGNQTQLSENKAQLQNAVNALKDEINAHASNVAGYCDKADSICLHAEDIVKRVTSAVEKVNEEKENSKQAYADFEVTYNAASEEYRNGFSDIKGDFNSIMETDFSGINAEIGNNVINLKNGSKAAYDTANAYNGFSVDAAATQPALPSANSNWATVSSSAKCAEAMQTLTKWYGSASSTENNSRKKALEDALDKNKDPSNEVMENAEAAKRPKGALSIPPQISDMLLSSSQQGSEASPESGLDSVEKSVSDFSGKYEPSIFDAMKNFAGDAVHKMMLVEYDLGMFSHSTTGISDGKYEEEETISGIPKSPKMNYFFGSELEYLFTGTPLALVNITAAQGTVLGFLSVRNFVASFSNKGINSFTNKISAAVPSAPLKIATKIGLHLLIAGIESGYELTELNKGGQIELIKATWKLSIESLAS